MLKLAQTNQQTNQPTEQPTDQPADRAKTIYIDVILSQDTPSADGEHIWQIILKSHNEQQSNGQDKLLTFELQTKFLDRQTDRQTDRLTNIYIQVVTKFGENRMNDRPTDRQTNRKTDKVTI
ncbi:hypothetical protein DPMN_022219 [Dreissena polymorpha]|uniref:Uncharacterized protein n=1 Tax=Dreissena polymorpha TaxID=45954 RepID=A0A9D4SCB7_DREPO|nr:hypothetical protein DPMN_022219 [Dreissena polymorpha]